MSDTEFITTQDDLIRCFDEIGVKEGMHVMVHASMSKFGYVVNGANDVIDALSHVVGASGTVLVSANTGQLTDPKNWKHPPVPGDFVEVIRKNMNFFDKRKTPIWNRGRVADVFLYYDNVERSDHPLRSIAARGRLAKHFTETHPLHDPEGVGSPLYRFYQARGFALLLGVNLSKCSAVHVAEFLADVPYLYKQNCKVLIRNEHGDREFVRLKKYSEAQYFAKLEPALIDKGYLKLRVFRDTYVKLVDVFQMVNYAVEVLKSDPEYFIKA